MVRRIPQKTDDPALRRRARISHYAQIEDIKQRARQDNQEDQRDAFLDMYKPLCSCCGESHREFLTVEYKNGPMNMNGDREQTAFREAVAEHRPDLFGVLCWNCNYSLARFAYCPHNKARPL